MSPGGGAGHTVGPGRQSSPRSRREAALAFLAARDTATPAAPFAADSRPPRGAIACPTARPAGPAIVADRQISCFHEIATFRREKGASSSAGLAAVPALPRAAPTSTAVEARGPAIAL